MRPRSIENQHDTAMQTDCTMLGHSGDPKPPVSSNAMMIPKPTLRRPRTAKRDRRDFAITGLWADARASKGRGMSR